MNAAFRLSLNDRHERNSRFARNQTNNNKSNRISYLNDLSIFWWISVRRTLICIRCFGYAQQPSRRVTSYSLLRFGSIALRLVGERSRTTACRENLQKRGAKYFAPLLYIIMYMLRTTSSDQSVRPAHRCRCRRRRWCLEHRPAVHHLRARHLLPLALASV